MIHQVQYWSNVQQFGVKALQGPRVLGRRHRYADHDNSERYTIFGPDYMEWFTATGLQAPAPMIPPGSSLGDQYRVELATRVRADVLNAEMKNQLSNQNIFEWENNFVADWERRRNLARVAIVPPDHINEYRVQAEIRRIRLGQVTDAIAAQNSTLGQQQSNQEELERQENLARALLDHAEQFDPQNNVQETIDHCHAILQTLQGNSSSEKILRARAHTVLGILQVEPSRDHLNAAINTYKAFQIMQVHGIDESLTDLIKNVQNVIDSHDEAQNRRVREEFERQERIIHNAIQATWANHQNTAAGLCVSVLNSEYTAIKAQAHLLLARLDRTPDQLQHAEEARLRFEKLKAKASQHRDWDAMIKAAKWVLDRDYIVGDVNTISLNESHDGINRAQVQVSSGMPNAILSAIMAYRMLSQSPFLAVRARCHYALASLNQAGDDLFRRMEAFMALEDLQVLQQSEPTNPTWPAMIATIHQVLGGATQAQWDASALALGTSVSMDNLVRNLGSIG